MLFCRFFLEIGVQRQRYSREQWHGWLEEQPVSGLSIAAFCRDKGISQNSFYRWRRKLARELSDIRPGAKFVPLAVIGGSEITVDLPGGATVRFVPHESTTRQVLSILCELGPNR
jgi:transposase-like protein